MKRIYKNLSAVSVLAIMQSAMMTANAQEVASQDAGDSFEFDEIMVTAQKREQSVLDVPISISVIGQSELEALRVEGIEDYAFTVPGVSFTRSSRSTLSLAIRGITGASGGQYSPIGVTIDDVAYGAIDSAVILAARALDIERIEVLRGPQGTLTGANSLGGTISIVTAKPDPEAFSAKVTLDYGRFDTKIVKAVVNTPVSDTFAVRALGYMESSDGAVKNTVSHSDSTSDNVAGRLALRWMPSDRLTIDADFTYDRQRYGMENYLNSEVYDSEEDRQEIIDLYENHGFIYDAVGLDYFRDAGNNGGEVQIDYPEYDNIDSWWASFRVNYEMDEHTVDLIYGHYDFHHNRARDDDKTILPIGVRYADRYATANSFELRISSNYDGPVNWVAGLSYHDEKNPFEILGVESREIGDNIWAIDDPYSEFWFKYANSEILKTRAAFANVFWDISEKLHLSAGVRYTKVKARYGEECCGDFSAPDPFVVPLPEIVHAEGNNTEINPRIALTYDLTESASLYAQFATGYRAGYGNDARITSLDIVPDRVEGEDVRNYEVGIKSYFLDNRVSFNAAAFLMDYKNLQVFGGDIELDDFGEVGFDMNAGKASVKGFEAEFSARPTSELEFRATVSHVDSGIEELAGTVYDPVLRLPGIRPWTGTFGATYNKQVTEDYAVFARADYVWQNETYDEFEREPTTHVSDINTLDVSFGIEAAAWTLSAYFENILNDKYWTAYWGSDRPMANFEPRMYGIRLTYQWGQ